MAHRGEELLLLDKKIGYYCYAQLCAVIQSLDCTQWNWHTCRQAGNSDDFVIKPSIRVWKYLLPGKYCSYSGFFSFMLKIFFLISKYYTISIIIYHPTFSLVKLKTSGRITGKTTRNSPDYESKYLSSHKLKLMGVMAVLNLKNGKNRVD